MDSLCSSFHSLQGFMYTKDCEKPTFPADWMCARSAGEHAAALGDASDKEVAEGVDSLYSSFPAIPKPQGGKPQVLVSVLLQIHVRLTRPLVLLAAHDCLSAGASLHVGHQRAVHGVLVRPAQQRPACSPVSSDIDLIVCC